MVKADGSVLVHADAGGYKPLNWMTPPTVIEESPPTGGAAATMIARKRPGASAGPLRNSISEVLSRPEHAMGPPDEDPTPATHGVEADLQGLLADLPARGG